MKIIEYALKHKSFIALLMGAALLGGVLSYERMGRLEYPNFTIKKATVATLYPGASAREVEEEVTDKIEEEIQKMSQIDHITSISRDGFSLIYVDIRPEFENDEIPQVWDELRRKINDIKPYLPEGVPPSKVGDDFGDVYGVYLSLSGNGYTLDELKDYADLLKKKLLRVPNVAKVEFWGVPQKTVYAEFNRAKLANMQISQEMLFNTLRSNNMVTKSGQVQILDEYPEIRVSGAIDGVEAIRNLYVTDGQKRLIRLGDIAEIYRGHAEPAGQIMSYNGEPAIGIGISTVAGGNVVAMGDDVKKLLVCMENEKPAGMQINYINYQADDVQNSLNEFVVNLLESVAIVIGILLITMGWRAGLVIGVTLILIIAGTFVGMKMMDIDMQLVSLGALIIALGMLVDNAIVIVDGFLVKTARGTERETALQEVVHETQWPLLGATMVAILAFLAVGYNPGDIGEFCRSLFFVIVISLFLSWIMALSFTPLLCLWLIKPIAAEKLKEDVYAGKWYMGYKRLLAMCLKHRIGAMIVLLLSLAGAIWGFSKVPKTFFPDSTRRQFYIDYWRNSASHINETGREVAEIAKYIRTLPGVKSTASFVGEGTLRFILTYDYNSPSPDYGQILVEVDDYKKINGLVAQIDTYLQGNYPSADALVQRFAEGKIIPYKIEARFSGPDRKVLRKLAEEAKTVMRNNPNTRFVRDDWRPLQKSMQLKYSEIKARQTGITRDELSDALQWNFNGVTCGVLREQNELIPVISRPVAEERKSVGELENVQIWSHAANRSYPLAQACDEVSNIWEPPQLRHRDRIPAITVQCNPKSGTAAELQTELQAAIEAIKLPPLYTLEWGGELHESTKAEAGLKTLFPISLLLMFIVMAALFRTIREPLVAFATLPFAIIGVMGGLLLMNLPFGFMAILGFLGLSGMLLKNAIVLLDQINLERAKNQSAYQAVLMASISRLRPVTMAAGTTVLGVLPLLFHVFYASMAATIMFGLLGATVLTLFIVPMGYCILFKIKDS